MKKTYISPELMLIELQANQMIAESLPYDPSKEVDEGRQYVKEDFSFRDRSNVWDDWDDWDD